MANLNYDSRLGVASDSFVAPVGGLGNIGSHLPMASGDALKQGINWLGAGYNEHFSGAWGHSIFV
jgi:hypothetical protein